MAVMISNSCWFVLVFVGAFRCEHFYFRLMKIATKMFLVDNCNILTTNSVTSQQLCVCVCVK